MHLCHNKNVIEMKLSINSQVVINAPVEKVWKVLLDFENHPLWNPFFKKIEGEPIKGNQILLEINGMTFKPTILTNMKNQELRWLGSLFFRGLFDGEHFFKLEDLGNNSTRLEHGENFSGILVALLKNKLLTDTINGFESLNEGLKNRVENL